ncbi:MAG: hypothetical protein K8U03_21680 [Planctomycetia bacterium]|nr:hypothetical protein [Planctomycetia bacterium]
MSTALGAHLVVGQQPVGPAAPSLEAPFVRRQIFVGLPTSQESASGQLFLAPNVNVGSVVATGSVPGQAQFRQSALNDDVTSQVLQTNSEQDANPPPGSILGPSEILPGPDGIFAAPGTTTPIFSEIIQQPAPVPVTGLRAWLMSKRPTGSGGLGRERLAFAPFEIDVSAPNPSMRARLVSVRGAQYPDRAEYLWARTVNGRGPKLAESGLDYQETRFQMELGSKRFSTATEIPIRFTNPDVNQNHTSIGDMNLTVKTVLLDGKVWQITQLFRSFFPTGSPSMGLGTGHVSFEPGFLARYNSCDKTYYHGQLKYFFPVGGDPMFQGQVLTYGVGMSHILFDSDDFCVLPTMELVGNYIANGLRTQPNGVVADAAGEHILALYPGFRVARDRGSELGLLEWGMSMGLPITGPRFYDSIFRFDFRVHF